MATFASIEAAKIAAGDIEPDQSTSVDPKYEPKKLSTTGVSAIFDLKSELLKKKSQVVKSSLSDEYRVGKSGLLAVKKDEREELKREKAARKDRISELARKIRQDEQDALAKSERRLREKAELYDKLSKGTVLHHKDNTPVEFMVDFSGKDKGRRTPDYDEPSSSSKVTPQHFDPDSEHRVYGVSHIKLSTDEAARQDEIQRIKNISKETEKEREQHTIFMEQQAEKRRLRTNRLRRQMGLPEIKEPTPPPVEDIPLPPPVDHQKAFEEETVKRLKSDREWDRGKDRYNQWIEKQREERDDDFRPPDSYYR